MNLIDDRDARTKARKKAKDEFDSNINLSLAHSDRRFTLAPHETSEGKVRLLDEGAIVCADGSLDIFIEKGTIEKYVNGQNEHLRDWESKEVMNLTDDYEGTINLGHHDFATFPFILGTWTRDDLSIVDNGDGRKGLDVDLKLNEEHPLVQALRVQDIPVGVSVEMYLHFDEKISEEEGMPVVDEVFIADFAIVGECGNVGSSDSVYLQGVKMEDSVKDTESIEEETLEETAEENEMPVDVEDTEEVEETTEETEAEETEEAKEDESVDEEANDEAESEEVEDEEDALAVAEETINNLKAEIESLKEQVEALKKSNNKKDRKIKESAEKNEEFIKKFKGLEISIGNAPKEVKKETVSTNYRTGGNGIGE